MTSSVSARKREANRRNARRSTGPKSVEAKLLVSLNATSHGLSVKVEPEWVRWIYPGLIDALKEDGLTDACALYLAMRIVDYERVESRLLQEYESAYGLPFAVRRGTGSASQGTVGLNRPADWGSQDLAQCRRFLQLTDPNFLKSGQAQNTMLASSDPRSIGLYRKIALFLVKADAKYKARRKAQQKAKQRFGLERYYKRASNQLIKAVMGLAVAWPCNTSGDTDQQGRTSKVAQP